MRRNKKRKNPARTVLNEGERRDSAEKGRRGFPKERKLEGFLLR